MKRNIFILIIVILTFSCVRPAADNDKSDMYVYFLLRGPGTCVCRISMDSFGNAIAEKGYSKDYYEDEFVNFDTIIRKKAFQISHEDLFQINTALEKYKQIEHYEEGEVWLDMMRLELFIHDRKVLNCYNWYSHPIGKILITLSRYIPFNINEKCG